MKKIIPILLLGSTLSYAANIEVTINNIKPVINRLSIALDTVKEYLW
ncbi:hypothetical protein HUE58_05590 [Candidatus Ruthia endofausta]|uniref:Uncharacterized protein n=1 Tax=Candidatus Ruthia endofausta TaxID=2738852 RepID=A0A6N0HQH6_9GAMM|nr:hypothetical protein [Candidatus Ruthia endofausta]QKQ24576.1 hypothetical protein HUE58_05590 [Candidatus Ruthia endofausta]